MNYINKDKNYMTDTERIRYLEESIRELRKEKENLKKEKGELKARLEEENKKLKEEIESLKLHIEAKDEAYMKLLRDYEELKNCGRYVFDCSKYDFTWLTSTTPQLEVSKKSDSGDVFTK